MRFARVCVLAAFFSFIAGPFSGLPDEPSKKSSAVVVEGKRLSFDPKTCTDGQGRFAWSLGSVQVTMRGHEKDNCVFDYQWEVEGAGNHAVYRVKVPIESGPVVIEAQGKKGTQENQWSHVFTSFTKKQAMLIRRYVFGWQEDLVEGTGEFVAHRPSGNRAKNQPVRGGDEVLLRFIFYSGADFKNLADGAKQDQTVRLIIGKGEDWKWVRVASMEMRLGETRYVRVPAKIAGVAKDWLPRDKPHETIYLGMEMTKTGQE